MLIDKRIMARIASLCIIGTFVLSTAAVAQDNADSIFSFGDDDKDTKTEEKKPAEDTAPAAPAAPAADTDTGAAAPAAPGAPAADAGGDVAAGPDVAIAGFSYSPGQNKIWKEMLYYVRVARPQMANSQAQALFATSGYSPKIAYELSVANAMSRSYLVRGQKLEGFGDTAAKLLEAIEEGFKQWRSDPQQIKNTIELLGKSLRGYAIAVERLKLSGEYAIPLLIAELMKDPREEKQEIIQHRIITMLPEMGPCAVRAYSVALQSENMHLVSYLANALGKLGYPSALPRLREAYDRLQKAGGGDTDLRKSTRKIVASAMVGCAGNDTTILSKPADELFYQLARKYYYRAESLRPDPRYPDEAGFAWFWKPATGVVQVPVPRKLLCDIYAMRMSRLSLKYNPAMDSAKPLWMSAGIRRTLDLPPGAEDNLWPKDKPTIDYYLLASSPMYLQMVLARAMKDNEIKIAEKVVTTMGRNTGSGTLTDTIPGGAAPLVSAMGYPDKALRYLAAETLLKAMPVSPFKGRQMVLALMNEALRQKGQKYAMLVPGDVEQGNKLKDVLRGAGFEVIAEPDVNKLLLSAEKAEAGLDLLVVGQGVNAPNVVNMIRRQMVFYYLPVIVTSAVPDMRDYAKRDGRMTLVDPDRIDNETITLAVEDVQKKAAGRPLDSTQALEWAIRSARAITVVGKGRKTVYNLKRTITPLINALGSDSTDLQTAAAQALSTIDDAGAQRRVIELALNEVADPAVRVAAFNAASESVRLFDNYSTEVQARALVKLVSQVGTGQADQKLREAAAQLLGTMNLPIVKKPELIQSTDDID